MKENIKSIAMKKSTLVTLLLLTAPTLSSAKESHNLGFGLNYHLDQENGPGYQFSYQWQFSESFELDSRYISNNDVKIINDDVDMLGNYSQFSIGANFIKKYNRELAIKAGTGLAFVTSSSNKQLVDTQAMAPYLMLAINYQVSKNIALELGQLSHFNKEDIGINHSLYFTVSMEFGDSYRSFQSVFSNDSSNDVTQENDISQQASEAEPMMSNPMPVANKIVNEANIKYVATSKLWYVQFGAYTNLVNAQQSLARLTQSVPDQQMSLVKSQQYYRILSQPFESKQRAEDCASMVNLQHAISGYVTQLEK